MKKISLMLCIIFYLYSCNSKYSNIENKKYYYQDICSYKEIRLIEFNEKKEVYESDLDYCVPFLFKADQINIVKDSILLIFEKPILCKKLNIASKFKAFIPLGTAGLLTKFDINLKLDAFLTDEIPPEVIKLIESEIVDCSKREVLLENLNYPFDKIQEIRCKNHYITLMKGVHKVYEIYTANEIMFFFDKYALVVPLQKKANNDLINEIEVFTFFGIAFGVDWNVIFLPEEKEVLKLKDKDIIKLLGE